MKLLLLFPKVFFFFDKLLFPKVDSDKNKRWHYSASKQSGFSNFKKHEIDSAIKEDQSLLFDKVD